MFVVVGGAELQRTAQRADHAQPPVAVLPPTIAGPVIAGVIADRFGFGPAFWLTAALAAAVGVLWVVTRETRGRTPLAPAPPPQPDL